ncbi:MAG: hypothetical protein QGH83_16080 [Candidatus Pacebacteria bacterium]|nr:hypothetical protein [Candidatus Paceibacterota bacterium]
MTEKEKREFLRDLLVFREHIRKSKQKKKKSIPQKEIETRIKNRLLDKLFLKIKALDDGGVLPMIDIPETMHTREHGELVFRIDKENDTIRILRRIYEWDSDKDDIDDE